MITSLEQFERIRLQVQVFEIKVASIKIFKQVLKPTILKLKKYQLRVNSVFLKIKYLI